MILFIPDAALLSEKQQLNANNADFTIQTAQWSELIIVYTYYCGEISKYS